MQLRHFSSGFVIYPKLIVIQLDTKQPDCLTYYFNYVNDCKLFKHEIIAAAFGGQI